MYIAVHVVPHVLYGVHAQHLHVTRPAMHCTEYKGHYYKSLFSTAQYVTLFGKAVSCTYPSLHFPPYEATVLTETGKVLTELHTCDYSATQGKPGGLLSIMNYLRHDNACGWLPARGASGLRRDL